VGALGGCRLGGWPAQPPVFFVPYQIVAGRRAGATASLNLGHIGTSPVRPAPVTEYRAKHHPASLVCLGKVAAASIAGYGGYLFGPGARHAKASTRS